MTVSQKIWFCKKVNETDQDRSRKKSLEVQCVIIDSSVFLQKSFK